MSVIGGLRRLKKRFVSIRSKGVLPSSGTYHTVTDLWLKIFVCEGLVTDRQLSSDLVYHEKNPDVQSDPWHSLVRDYFYLTLATFLGTWHLNPPVPSLYRSYWTRSGKDYWLPERLVDFVTLGRRPLPPCHSPPSDECLPVETSNLIRRIWFFERREIEVPPHRNPTGDAERVHKWEMVRLLSTGEDSEVRFIKIKRIGREGNTQSLND